MHVLLVAMRLLQHLVASCQTSVGFYRGNKCWFLPRKTRQTRELGSVFSAWLTGALLGLQVDRLHCRMIWHRRDDRPVTMDALRGLARLRASIHRFAPNWSARFNSAFEAFGPFRSSLSRCFGQLLKCYTYWYLFG